MASKRFIGELKHAGMLPSERGGSTKVIGLDTHARLRGHAKRKLFLDRHTGNYRLATPVRKRNGDTFSALGVT